MTNAPEREDAEEIVGRVRDVRAFARRSPRRNPELTQEAHDVVDAQRARVRERATHEANPIVVAALGQSARIDRRQAPVLAGRPERIGRRAEARAGDEKVRERPRVASAGRGADGEILVDADGEPRVARAPCGRRELAVELELRVAVEVDRLGVRVAERAHLGRARIAQRRWPRAPAAGARARARLARLAGERLLDRDERREVAQRLALLGEEARVRAAALRRAPALAHGERAVQSLERRALEPRDPLVVHERRRARRRDLRLEGCPAGERARFVRCTPLGNRLDVDVERVAEEPAHRIVRADLPAGVAEGVERVDADERAADFAGPGKEVAEVGEVAGAPVARAAHGVEARADAEGARRPAHGRRAAVGDDDERLLAVARVCAAALSPRDGRAEDVVAEVERRVERDDNVGARRARARVARVRRAVRAGRPFRVGGAALAVRAFAEAQRAIDEPLAPAFLAQRDAHRRAARRAGARGLGHAHAHRERARLRRAHDARRRDEPLALRRVERRERVRRGVLRRRVVAHRRDERDARRIGRRVLDGLDVAVRGEDAEPIGERKQSRALRRRAHRAGTRTSAASGGMRSVIDCG
jgi:hypothetical protein